MKPPRCTFIMTWISEFNVIAQDKCCLGHDCISLAVHWIVKWSIIPLLKLLLLISIWLLFNIGLTISSAKNRCLTFWWKMTAIGFFPHKINMHWWIKKILVCARHISSRKLLFWDEYFLFPCQLQSRKYLNELCIHASSRHLKCITYLFKYLVVPQNK